MPALDLAINGLQRLLDDPHFETSLVRDAVAVVQHQRAEDEALLRLVRPSMHQGESLSRLRALQKLRIVFRGKLKVEPCRLWA